MVPAQEILDKIEKGLPVEYDHVIIKGDLDLRKLDLPKRRVERTSYDVDLLYLSKNAKIVSSSIGLNDSTIEDNVYFSNTIFDNSVNFNRSEFNNAADFRGSYFNGHAYFWYSEFKGDAGFGSLKFNRTAYFLASEFNGYAYFIDSKFNSSDFYSVQFNKLVSFEDAMFNNSASFNSVRFKDDALFEGAVFDDTLDLTRAKYDKLYIRWKNIKELRYDDAAYLALQENFKKLGYLEDYDGCYYEYRKAHRGQDWSGKYHAMMSPSEERIRKHILDVALDEFYGYGKKPILPLFYSGVTILLFGLIWWMVGLKRDNGENHRGIFEKYCQQDAARKRSWKGELGAVADALLFSATLFLSGTRLFVDPPQMPQMSRLSPSWTRLAFILERVLGAFFSILFFLAISGTVVR